MGNSTNATENNSINNSTNVTENNSMNKNIMKQKIKDILGNELLAKENSNMSKIVSEISAFSGSKISSFTDTKIFKFINIIINFQSYIFLHVFFFIFIN